MGSDRIGSLAWRGSGRVVVRGAQRFRRAMIGRRHRSHAHDGWCAVLRRPYVVGRGQ
jgi:hypothetical protein